MAYYPRGGSSDRPSGNGGGGGTTTTVPKYIQERRKKAGLSAVPKPATKDVALQISKEAVKKFGKIDEEALKWVEEQERQRGISPGQTQAQLYKTPSGEVTFYSGEAPRGYQAITSQEAQRMQTQEQLERAATQRLQQADTQQRAEETSEKIYERQLSQQPESIKLMRGKIPTDPREAFRYQAKIGYTPIYGQTLIKKETIGKIGSETLLLGARFKRERPLIETTVIRRGKDYGTITEGGVDFTIDSIIRPEGKAIRTVTPIPFGEETEGFPMFYPGIEKTIIKGKVVSKSTPKTRFAKLRGESPLTPLVDKPGTYQLAVQPFREFQYGIRDVGDVLFGTKDEAGVVTAKIKPKFLREAAGALPKTFVEFSTYAANIPPLVVDIAPKVPSIAKGARKGIIKLVEEPFETGKKIGTGVSVATALGVKAFKKHPGYYTGAVIGGALAIGFLRGRRAKKVKAPSVFKAQVKAVPKRKVIKTGLFKIDTSKLLKGPMKIERGIVLTKKTHLFYEIKTPRNLAKSLKLTAKSVGKKIVEIPSRIKAKIPTKIKFIPYKFKVKFDIKKVKPKPYKKEFWAIDLATKKRRDVLINLRVGLDRRPTPKPKPISKIFDFTRIRKPKDIIFKSRIRFELDRTPKVYKKEYLFFGYGKVKKKVSKITIDLAKGKPPKPFALDIKLPRPSYYLGRLKRKITEKAPKLYVFREKDIAKFADRGLKQIRYKGMFGDVYYGVTKPKRSLRLDSILKPKVEVLREQFTIMPKGKKFRFGVKPKGIKYAPFLEMTKRIRMGDRFSIVTKDFYKMQRKALQAKIIKGIREKPFFLRRTLIRPITPKKVKFEVFKKVSRGGQIQLIKLKPPIVKRAKMKKLVTIQVPTHKHIQKTTQKIIQTGKQTSRQRSIQKLLGIQRSNQIQKQLRIQDQIRLQRQINIQNQISKQQQRQAQRQLIRQIQSQTFLGEEQTQGQRQVPIIIQKQFQDLTSRQRQDIDQVYKVPPPPIPLLDPFKRRYPFRTKKYKPVKIYKEPSYTPTLVGLEFLPKIKATKKLKKLRFTGLGVRPQVKL